jgi:hypothetical protein
MEILSWVLAIAFVGAWIWIALYLTLKERALEQADLEDSPPR